MSVGLLIISHDGIGPVMLGTALHMLGDSVLNTRLLNASRDNDLDELYLEAGEHLKSLDDGDGILVIADLYGSTPSNIAQRLASQDNVRAITGLNLPMLLRILNYPQLGLVQLADKALGGGRDGIALLENT